MGELLRRAGELDPTVLIDAGRGLPGWLGWICIAVGLGFAAFGAHEALLRLTSAVLAACAGLFAATGFLDANALGLSPTLLSWGAAGALGILGGIWPIAAGVVIGGFAGGPFLARWMPFEDPFLRALPGAVICGALAGFFVRAAAALASAFAGGAAVAVGVAAVLLHGGQAAVVEPHPVIPLLPFSLVFVSGAAFQLTRRPSPKPAPRKASPPGAEARLGGTA